MIGKSRGPGPGAYALPTTFGFNKHDIRKQRLPQYSFGTCHKSTFKGIGPGPGGYKVENVTRYGNDGTPKYTMRPRTFIRERSQGPGPAAHDVHIKPFFKGTTAPAFSLQSRNFPRLDKVASPPPNTYKVSVNMIKTTAPSFSMGLDLKTYQKPLSPGPATYGRTDLNVKLHNSPKYSITGRNLYLFKSNTPAPNAYNRSYYRPGISRPKYSFGTKHSDYAPPMVVPCDNI